MFQTQLKALVDLARAYPPTTIVLNHVGRPLAIGPYAGKRDEAFTEWRDTASARLRACPILTSSWAGLGRG